MRRMHWQEIQTELTRFPVPKEAWDLVGRDHPGLAVEAIADLFRSRIRIKPEANANPAALPAIRAEIEGISAAMAFFRVFGRRPSIYKIAKEFGEALKEVRCNVPPRYLNFDNRIHCIEFPDGMTFDMADGDHAQCAYVGMYRASEAVPIICDEISYPLMMYLTVPLWRYSETGEPFVCGQDNLKLYFENGDASIEASLEQSIAWVRAEGKTGFSIELLAYIVNCLLYINSGEPDLRHLKPEPKPKNAKAIKKWRKSPGADLPLPITLVGFDYKKPKEFRVGEAFRRAHKRWQPCGPRRETLKLVWVREHTMHFKKAEL